MSLVHLGWLREIWHGGLGVGPVGPVRPSSNLSQSGSCCKRDLSRPLIIIRSNGWHWWLYSINTLSPFSFGGYRFSSAIELLSRVHSRWLRLPTPPPYSISHLIICLRVISSHSSQFTWSAIPTQHARDHSTNPYIYNYIIENYLNKL